MLAVLAVPGIALAGRVGWVGYGPAPGPEELTGQLRFLEAALSRGEAERMQELFPEGSYFLRALTAMAETADPDGDLDLARRLLAGLDEPESVAVFGSGMVPEHGIFQAGWALAVSVELARASGDRADAEDVRRRAVVVDAALRDSRTGFLEGYPGQYWPCDSVVAASTLADAAVLLGKGEWLDTVRRWRDRVGVAADPATGLLPHRVGDGGRMLEGPRGSSQSIIQAFWPSIGRALDGRADPQTWWRFHGAFVVRKAGLVGVREYPKGTTGEGDVDSGPLVVGVSASASAVTLAAARSVGDQALADDLTRQAELLGLPVAWRGQRRYAFGALPVGDAFLAWARSRPVSAAVPAPEAFESVRTWWPVWVGLGLLPGMALLGMTVLSGRTGSRMPH